MSLLPPKSVFITGCDKGLGLEMVRQFSSLPVPPDHIFATGLDVEGSEELIDLAKRFASIGIKNFDILDYQSYQSIIDWVKDTVGEDGLNLLINNAGIMDASDLSEVTRDKMMRTFEINAVAPLIIVQAFEPLLKKAAHSKHGLRFTYSHSCVINISSKIGSIDFNNFPGFYPYKVSKAALNMVTKCLSVDLKKDGILCIALHPGWVLTDMGGKDAPLKIEESVSMIIKTISELRESDHGCFKNVKGDIILW